MNAATYGALAAAGVSVLGALAAYLRARTAHKAAANATITAKTALGVAAGAESAPPAAPPSPMGQ